MILLLPLFIKTIIQGLIIFAAIRLAFYWPLYNEVKKNLPGEKFALILAEYKNNKKHRYMGVFYIFIGFLLLLFMLHIAPDLMKETKSIEIATGDKVGTFEHFFSIYLWPILFIWIGVDRSFRIFIRALVKFVQFE